MSSSRVFIDKDVPPTIDYLSWYVFLWQWILHFKTVIWFRVHVPGWLRSEDPYVASMFIALEVTKVETLTIGEIYAFLRQEPIQVVWKLLQHK